MTFVPTWLADDIKAQITGFPRRLRDQSLDKSRTYPLAIKYVSAQYAKTYRSGSARLRISDTPGFTWGNGTYVAPLAFPLSSAIFGRIGVAAAFDPVDWRVFDATAADAQQLYMQWVGLQPRARQLMLTYHAQVANQFLRNLFRTAFHIDCVLFRPDQRNHFYTKHTDVWMAVADWKGNELVKSGFSTKFHTPKMVVIVEEEFDRTKGDIRYPTLIGPNSRLPDNASAAAEIRNAYAAPNRLLHLHA